MHILWQLSVEEFNAKILLDKKVRIDYTRIDAKDS